MRRSRKQQLLKKRARVQLAAVAAYALIVTGVGVIWVAISRAASNCADTAPCAVQGTSVANANWSLVFADEFSGNVLDSSKWSTGRHADTTLADEPYNAGREGAFFKSSNVSVANGAATIRLQPERNTIKGVTYQYSSGEINTERKLYLKPGQYVEARIKVPKCAGCWPAFWTVPVEFDIFEFFNTSVKARPAFNYHSAPNQETGPTAYGEAKADYRNSYHIFGMYWTETSVVPFLDGKPYPMNIGATTSVPEALILNLSTYARTQPGAAQMNIDWVRVWGPPEPAVNLASNIKPVPTVAPALAPGKAAADAGHEATDTPVVPPTVSNTYKVPVPEGIKKLKVSVDGTAVTTDNELNTRLLLNGRHVVTIMATTASGTTSTSTMHILVNNSLNLFELARNNFFAPFHGNIMMINLASIVFVAIISGGITLIWMVLHPKRRSKVAGLSI